MAILIQFTVSDTQLLLIKKLLKDSATATSTSVSREVKQYLIANAEFNNNESIIELQKHLN